MSNLSDRALAITGASSGIGRALALRAAKQGAHLALADIDASGLDTLRTELASHLRPGQQLFVKVVDVRERAAVLDFARDSTSAVGLPTALICCAGVLLYCPASELDTEDMHWVMDTNFWGAVHATLAFLPLFLEAGRGHVINVSSLFGLGTIPGMGAYAAAKFALRGFTETLALEMATEQRPVHVTCVHPGGIKTPLVRHGRVVGSGPWAKSKGDIADSFDRDMARTSAEDCAASILELIERPRSRLLIGLDARLGDLLVRLFPSSYKNLLARALRKSFAPRAPLV